MTTDVRGTHLYQQSLQNYKLCLLRLVKVTNWLIEKAKLKKKICFYVRCFVLKGDQWTNQNITKTDRAHKLCLTAMETKQSSTKPSLPYCGT